MQRMMRKRWIWLEKVRNFQSGCALSEPRRTLPLAIFMKCKTVAVDKFRQNPTSSFSMISGLGDKLSKKKQKKLFLGVHEEGVLHAMATMITNTSS